MTPATPADALHNQCVHDEEHTPGSYVPSEYQRALAILEQHLGPFDARLLPVLYNLISANDQLGRHDVAERFIWRVKEILEMQRPAKSQSA